MKYPDVVRLATTTSDGYGDRTVTVLNNVEASFIKRSGLVHAENTEGETSDAAVYLLPTDQTVLDNLDDLEGMYIQFNTNWYRISGVNVAERKLLDNKLDNVYCQLEKVAGMPYAVVS